VTTSLVGQRTPVAIDDGLIRAGSQTAAFDRAQPETLLRNYLRLIRRARSQQRAPEISLRREDVEALAEYLGVPAESVLHRLANLMGSSRTQRNTMLAAFASGALIVGLSGSVAATSSVFDTPATSSADAPVAAAVVDGMVAEPSAGVPGDGPPVSAEPAAVPGGTDATPTLADVATPGASVIVENDVSPAESASAESASTGSTGGGPVNNQPATERAAGGPADDVALVTPVVPDTNDNVAVGDAVVPPTTASPSDDAGNDGTGVDEPPVTETTLGPIDDVPHELPPVDDDTVAVGPPPLPPTTTTTTTTTTVPTTTTTVPTTTVPSTTVATTVPSTTVPPTTVPSTTVPSTTTPA
jgi:hypothetical protein